jgi:hypothetical protein
MTRGGRRHRLVQPLHKLRTAEDPLIPAIRLAPPAEGRDGLPPPQTAAEAPALQLGAAALGEAGDDEGPVGPPGAGDPGTELSEDGGSLLPGPGDGPAERPMAGPGVPVQGAELGDHLGAHRIKMEVADELQQVRLFFHHDGLVPVLEEVAHAPVAPVEGRGVPGEERAHEPGDRPRPRAEQEVGVIGEQGPGVDGPGPGLGERRHTADKVVPVGVVAEEGRPLDPPHHHVVEDSRGIEAGLARHSTGRLVQIVLLGNVP